MTNTKRIAHTVGNKYEATRDLDVAEIAKLIRKDLKAAFPGSKFSVRTRRFAGGCAIDTELKSWAGDLSEIVTVKPEKICGVTEWKFTRNLDAINAIVEAYNFDNSDSMTDYFDEGKVVLFEGHPLYAVARQRVERLQGLQSSGK